MALLDIVQRNLATAGTEPVPTTDQTGRARQLLAAKSGKVVSPGALAPQSAIAESVANDQTRQQLETLKPAGQLAAARVGQQVQQLGAQETGARADLELRKAQTLQANSLRKQELLANAAREGRKLDFDRDAAKLEQIAHSMRLSDKRYLDTLEVEGQKKRLEDDLAFKEELQKSILGSNTSLLKQSLGNKSVLSASDREFQEALAQIDINAALQMASNEAKDARQAAMISGMGGLASAGIQGYGAYSSTKPGTPGVSGAGADSRSAEHIAADAEYGD